MQLSLTRTSWLHESINSFFCSKPKQMKRLFPVVTLVVRSGQEEPVEAERGTLSSLKIFNLFLYILSAENRSLNQKCFL